MNVKRQKIVIKEKNLSDSLIKSLPGVFYLYNQEGHFIRWNKNFTIVTGYSNDELLQMHPLDFFAGPDKQLLAGKISNVFVTGEDAVEAAFLLKSGKQIPIILQAAA
ncbi:MAG: PAS domain S-box protein [Chitinophagaceae bacterium]|nr:PAS domain S-box protein [Chitinophagaceae bacterium]